MIVVSELAWTVKKAVSVDVIVRSVVRLVELEPPTVLTGDTKVPEEELAADTVDVAG